MDLRPLLGMKALLHPFKGNAHLCGFRWTEDTSASILPTGNTTLVYCLFFFSFLLSDLLLNSFLTCNSFPLPHHPILLFLPLAASSRGEMLLPPSLGCFSTDFEVSVPGALKQANASCSLPPPQNGMSSVGSLPGHPRCPVTGV